MCSYEKKERKSESRIEIPFPIFRENCFKKILDQKILDEENYLLFRRLWKEINLYTKWHV